MRATLSILGLYQYDNTIFDLMSLPENLSISDVADQICAECAELEILYPNPTVLKNLIGVWSKREYPTWMRVLAASEAEYNPIDNYNRSDSISRSRTGSETHSGKDTRQDSGTDTTTGSTTTTNSGSDSTLHKYAAFDSETLKDQESDTTTYGSGSTGTSSGGTTYGRKNELTHGHQIADTSTETETINSHGNIGVTTTQRMLEQELDISPRLNIISYIVDSFKNRFCLLVY